MNLYFSKILLVAWYFRGKKCIIVYDVKTKMTATIKQSANNIDLIDSFMPKAKLQWEFDLNFLLYMVVSRKFVSAWWSIFMGSTR